MSICGHFVPSNATTPRKAGSDLKCSGVLPGVSSVWEHRSPLWVSDKTVEVKPIGRIALSQQYSGQHPAWPVHKLLVPGYLSAAWMNLVNQGNGGLLGKA